MVDKVGQVLYCKGVNLPKHRERWLDWKILYKEIISVHHILQWTQKLSLSLSYSIKSQKFLISYQTFLLYYRCTGKVMVSAFLTLKYVWLELIKAHKINTDKKKLSLLSMAFVATLTKLDQSRLAADSGRGTGFCWVFGWEAAALRLNTWRALAAIALSSIARGDNLKC